MNQPTETPKHLGTLWRGIEGIATVKPKERNQRFAILFGAKHASQLPRYTGNLRARLA